MKRIVFNTIVSIAVLAAVSVALSPVWFVIRNGLNIVGKMLAGV